MEKIDLDIWLREILTGQIDELGWQTTREAGGVLRVTGASGEIAFLLASSADDLALEDQDIPLIFVGDENVPLTGKFYAVLPQDVTANQLRRVIRNAHETYALKREQKERLQNLRRLDYELHELVECGKSLSAVNEVDLLLAKILEKARFLAGADAGSIYVVEGEEEEIERRTLRFKLSQNDSIDYQSSEFTMPVSTSSIAGAAAVMKQSINIADVRAVPEEASYRYDSSWDERTGYRTRSVLAVPMINQVGEVLGVVQLINKKRRPNIRLQTSEDVENEVIPMDPRTQELVETLASQAGVAMENAYLYDEIKRIFDGFIRASVHAIEQRDPTTSGHSFRVAALTRRLAEVVSEEKEGVFADVEFSEVDLKEIEVAGLLHDFGKVGVREEVLVKAKKLYPPNLKMIRSRFDYIRSTIENDHLHRRIMMIESGSPDEELEILDQASKRAVEQIEECWRIIRAANEPTVLAEGDFEKIEEIATKSYFDLGGQRQPFLQPDEVKALKIAKGSLTEDELTEIRSHVKHTISFLDQIPWGRSMRNVPKYAGAHHEKLDGSGYPHQLEEEEITLPSKMMAVADIYDALTAADRPYKKAVPLERALHILDLEVKDNHIDRDLMRLFREKEVYQVLNSMNGIPSPWMVHGEIREAGKD